MQDLTDILAENPFLPMTGIAVLLIIVGAFV